MSDPRLRSALLATAQALGNSALGAGTAGNVSVRCDGGFLITPSGIAYDRLDIAQLVAIDADGHWQGQTVPSSEWRMHQRIYQTRADVQALVHAHPRHATALACTRQGIPAFHYMVATAGGHDIRCSDYATFGSSELADTVVRALDGRLACLMANHGLMACGRSLHQALALAAEVENLAAQYLLARQAGTVVLLDGAEMDRVLEKFRHYGPTRQDA